MRSSILVRVKSSLFGHTVFHTRCVEIAKIVQSYVENFSLVELDCLDAEFLSGHIGQIHAKRPPKGKIPEHLEVIMLLERKPALRTNFWPVAL